MNFCAPSRAAIAKRGVEVSMLQEEKKRRKRSPAINQAGGEETIYEGRKKKGLISTSIFDSGSWGRREGIAQRHSFF